tara:strand:- start:44 stop:1219 length:1176 start_codon:yes stop_codon:yes gene_type:complete
MAITDKKTGVWGLDQVYNKENQGSIWTYSGPPALMVVGYADILAQNDQVSRSSPVQIPGTTWTSSSTDRGVGATSHYSGSMSAVKTDGTLWVWGSNSRGALGQNNQVSYSSPIQIPGTDWKQTTNGYRTTHAVKTDGTLWSSGYGEYGALANNLSGHPGSRSSPVQIPGTTWKSVAAQGYAVSAIKTDGTLWAWGLNEAGGLGQNNKTVYSSPRQIPGTNWKACHGGYSGISGVKTDGTLWTWGSNAFGGLGHNNQTQYSSPKQVPGTNWAACAMETAAVAVKTDGTLWTWGRNTYGQNGQNGSANAHYSSPVQIGSATDWNTGEKTLAANGNTSAAMKTDGTLWMFGRNVYGGFGINETVSYSSPVQVGSDFIEVSLPYEGHSRFAIQTQ